MMKVLVTGAKGFIGREVSMRLKLDHVVLEHVRSLSPGDKVSSNIIECDLEDENWLKHLTGVDAIIHLAAVAHNKSTNPTLVERVNVDATLNLANMAIEAGVKRFVFVSSIGVHGNNSVKPFNENDIPCPHSEYALSKLKAEKALLDLTRAEDLEVVVVRPPLVYGKGAPGNFRKLMRLVHSLPVLPFGLCTNKRNVISVQNLADFLVVCLEREEAANQIFCIAEDTSISIKDLTYSIAKGLGKRIYNIPIPKFLFLMGAALLGRSAEVQQLLWSLEVDSSKAHKLLGWKAPYSIDDSLSKLND
ncbi:NAD-dependent epimerase/dehydratase family protein [Maricurvus nonylphenolicus]|uniref:NAD-dependent epimerase/dehydratase family protein n=1 Tax=Maricurvus nonylphenolicus TaxID=1008307 RepID=UPI0036F219B9